MDRYGFISISKILNDIRTRFLKCFQKHKHRVLHFIQKKKKIAENKPCIALSEDFSIHSINNVWYRVIISCIQACISLLSNLKCYLMTLGVGNSMDLLTERFLFLFINRKKFTTIPLARHYTTYYEYLYCCEQKDFYGMYSLFSELFSFHKLFFFNVSNFMFIQQITTGLVAIAET